MPSTPSSTKLRSLIRESGIPLRQLARDTGVTFNGLYNWFRGNPASSDIDSLERVYGHLTGGKSFIP